LNRLSTIHTGLRFVGKAVWTKAGGQTLGVELRLRMNVNPLMWSTDFLHSGSDWPEARIIAERIFRGVPRDEVKKMLHGNCTAKDDIFAALTGMASVKRFQRGEREARVQVDLLKTALHAVFERSPASVRRNGGGAPERHADERV
jgi:hypothetical protein